MERLISCWIILAYAGWMQKNAICHSNGDNRINALMAKNRTDSRRKNEKFLKLKIDNGSEQKL